MRERFRPHQALKASKLLEQWLGREGLFLFFGLCLFLLVDFLFLKMLASPVVLFTFFFFFWGGGGGVWVSLFKVTNQKMGALSSPKP